MLQGSTLFLGDSMMVGTSALVPVAGERLEVAKVGAPSTWALDQLKGQPLRSFKNLVVLTGVNDVASGRLPEAIAETLVHIWRLGKDAGLRVYAATLPPFKGWPSFQPFSPFEEKRSRLNALITQLASTHGVTVLPLSSALADPADEERLAPQADSGDHLHPKKPVLAGAIASLAMSAPSAPSAPSTSGWPLALGLGAAFVYLAWRFR